MQDTGTEGQNSRLGYPVHPLAQALPEMPQNEFQAFKQDILKHGQLEPIEILEGMVLDGRHRQRACRELDIEPWYAFLPADTDPLQHILSKNLYRRSASKSQMSIAAVRVYLPSQGSVWSGRQATADLSSDFAQMQIAPLNQDVAANMFGVSKRLFSQAIKLLEPASNAGRSLTLAAEQGLLTVGDASRVVDQPVEVQDAAVALVHQGHARTVSAAVKQVCHENTQAAHAQPQRLEPWHSATGDAVLHHCSIRELQDIMPPESVDVIITGAPSGGDAPQTLRELGRFGSHALKPNGALLLLCPSHLLPLPLRNVEQRGLNFITEFDYRFDVPTRQMDQPHRVAVRRMPLLIFGRHDFVLQDGDDVIQLPEVDGGPSNVDVRQRRAAGIDLIVKRFTQPGDLVCDPSLLSGSSPAVSSIRGGRRFLGSSHDSGLFGHVRDRLIQEDARRGHGSQGDSGKAQA